MVEFLILSELATQYSLSAFRGVGASLSILYVTYPFLYNFVDCLSATFIVPTMMPVSTHATSIQSKILKKSVLMIG